MPAPRPAQGLPPSGADVIFIAIFLGLLFTLWGLFLALTPPLQRLLTWSGHRTAAFRYRDYLSVVVVLVVGIAAASFAGDGFIDLAERVHAHSPQLQAIDKTWHDWARMTESTDATRFFTLMTMIGSPITLGIVVAIVAAILAIQKRFRWLLYLLFTTGTGALLNIELKAYFARARPELAEALRRAHGYSFPSGHAMGSTIVLGALSYLAFRAAHPWRLKAAALALAVTLVLAIASSRIYLGVHWISDVGAGISAGLLWVAACTIAYETFRRIRLVRALRDARKLKIEN